MIFFIESLFEKRYQSKYTIKVLSSKCQLTLLNFKTYILQQFKNSKVNKTK